MSALRKMLVVEDGPVVGKSIDRVLSGKGYVVITARAAAPVTEATAAATPVLEGVKEESRIKNIALFMVAPFIGLTYAMLFPFIGIGALVWFGCKELARMKVVKFVAAPFIGLALVVLLPFVGIATMAWVGAGGRMPHVLYTTT